jgi:Ser-tRNA(Ala) deacylase AlaX
MATKLAYLEEFDVVTCTASVMAIGDTDDDRTDVQLDKTCFYPRGGGQDWDMGAIKGDDAEFAVEEVRLDDDGTVHHIGTFRNGTFKVGDEVTCSVDTERRMINTRLHSAGHVIDMAVDALGLGWVPTKGQHYPNLSAVEYSGSWEPEKTEELRIAIESLANGFVKSGTENAIRFMPVEEMHTVCRHVPDNIPKNKPARVVMYGDFGIPCGGTHVKNVNQIGTVSIPKVKEKKGVIRVSYAVEGIN